MRFFALLMFSLTLGLAAVRGTANPVGPGAFLRDTEAPPALQAFSASTGASGGQIDVVLNFPAVVTDYFKVETRRLAGATAPNADCSSDGSIVDTDTSPFTPDPRTFTDSGTAGSYYSYRACVYDAVGNLTGTSTALNIQAKPSCAGNLVGGYCWYLTGAGASCTTYCSGKGGCDSAGVTWGQASGGNCGSIHSAITGGGVYGGAAGANNIGCWTVSGNYFTDTTGATCGGSFGGNTRYCACVN